MCVYNKIKMKKNIFLAVLWFCIFFVGVKFKINAETFFIKYNETYSVNRDTTPEQKVAEAIEYTVALQTTILVASQVGSGLAILQGLSIPDYLRFLFSLIISKKNNKRYFWGIIYDANTSKPIAYSVIRIFKAEDNSMVNTTVSDNDGRYGIIIDPGRYYIKVWHQDYSFPVLDLSLNKILANDNSIYLGKVFELSTAKSINFNIPLNPKQFKKGLNWSTIKSIWKKSGIAGISRNIYLIYFFFLLSLFLLYINFNILSIIIAIYYFIYIFIDIIKKISLPPKTWGTVFSSGTGLPISNVFVKMYALKSEAIIDTKITDSHGRFQFFVPNGKYLLILNAYNYFLDNGIHTSKEERNNKILFEVRGDRPVSLEIRMKEGITNNSSTTQYYPIDNKFKFNITGIASNK